MEVVDLGIDLGPPHTHILERREVVGQGALDGRVLRLKLLHHSGEVVQLNLHIVDAFLITSLVLRAEKVVRN